MRKVPGVYHSLDLFESVLVYHKCNAGKTEYTKPLLLIQVALKTFYTFSIRGILVDYKLLAWALGIMSGTSVVEYH
jgi:hypothetical protein